MESAHVTMERPALIRAIGRWALTAAVVNTVVGSGVFLLPSSLAGFLGEWSPLAVLIAGTGIFVIVLCFAEVASRFDSPGGPYLFTREAFGPALGFQIGWLHIWARLVSGAAVLNVISAYLSPLIPWTGTPAGRAVVMTFTIVLVTAVNVSGVRRASWTVTLFTIGKLLPLAFLITLGMFHLERATLATQAVTDPKWTDAVLLLMFGYGGFESSVVAASETRDPKRDTAFALITAMLAITLIYCLAQIVVIGVLPNAAQSKAPIAEALGRLLGPAGLKLGSIAVLISVYGWLTGFSLMQPRIFFSMASRHELPEIFARVHPDFRTPYVAIIVNSAAALGLGLASSFAQMATFGAIARLGIYIATCASLIALRRKHGPPQTFRLAGGPIFSIVGIGFCVWLLSTRDLNQAWFLSVIAVLGFVVWMGMSGARKSDYSRRAARGTRHAEAEKL